MMPLFAEVSDFISRGFVLNFLAYLCVFLVGFSLASLIRMIFAERGGRTGRFVSFCLCMSLSSVIFTLLIFKTGELFPYFKFASGHASLGFSVKSYWILVSAIFCLAFLVSLFWKIALPAFVILYALFSLANLYVLRAYYGESEEEISLIIDENSILLNSQSFPKDGGLTQAFLVDSCFLPDSLPLPIPRHYYAIRKYSEYKELSLPPEKETLIADSSNNSDFLHNPWISFYINTVLTKNEKLGQLFPLPQENVFPSLFVARFTFSQGKLSCAFSRTL
ncbi:MAG: hypothetical protein IJ630_08460 [Treponema sp.]|nr:hypothetical protein [Treponema sp.]